MARSKSKASFIGSKQYARRYRADHPLLQVRIPRKLYNEIQRRARANDFSLSKWASRWLEFTLAEHPRTEDA